MDAQHNVFGTPFLPPQANWVRADGQSMRQERFELDSPDRGVVLQAIREVCRHRGWTLLAVHVRSTHVHLVLIATDKAERILNDIKAYASRALNRSDPGSASRKRWTRHGSTRYLWKLDQVGSAIHYVVREQGDPMAVWERTESEPRP